MSRLTKLEALAILARCGIMPGTNFFTLDNATVVALLDEAKARGYRKARNAPGSTGRMFHGYVNRAAEQVEWVTEFAVRGHFGHGWEDVTTETTRLEARDRLREYRENDPAHPYDMVRRRVRVPA